MKSKKSVVQQLDFEFVKTNTGLRTLNLVEQKEIKGGNGDSGGPMSPWG